MKEKTNEMVEGYCEGCEKGWDLFEVDFGKEEIVLRGDKKVIKYLINEIKEKILFEE